LPIPGNASKISQVRILHGRLDPVTGRDIDAHFGHAFSDWLAIAEVPEACSVQPREDARSRPQVGELVEPRVELRRSPKDKHAEL
jgi:hypothetical protein